jgi:uncharacterized protein (TIGR02996 family)
MTTENFDDPREFARMFDGPDVVVILNAIRKRPDDGKRWLALASWLWDNGRDDEAATVRALWPTLRDNMAYVSLEATLYDVARHAKLLAKIARKMDRRADDTPPE